MRLNLLKAIGLMVGMVCVTVLLALNRIDDATGSALLSGAIFYLIGNGVNAARGGPDTSVIKPKPEGRRAEDRGDDEAP